MEVMEKGPVSQKSERANVSVGSSGDPDARNYPQLCKRFILAANGFDVQSLKAEGTNDANCFRGLKTSWMTVGSGRGPRENNSAVIFTDTDRRSRTESVLNGKTGSGVKEKFEEKRKRSPKIEVCQQDFKTVVKISVKESPCAEDDEKVFGVVDSEEGKVYENEEVHERFKMAINLKSESEESRDDVIYENVTISKGQSDPCCETGQCDYQNVFPNGCLFTNTNDRDGNGFNGNRTYANESEFQRIISPDPKENSKHVDDDATYENVENTCSLYTNEMFHKNQEHFNIGTIEGIAGKRGDGTVRTEAEVNDSGTSSDVDSLSTGFVHAQKGNVIVTIKSLQGEDPRKEEGGHRRAESLTSSGVGVDSEESDDEKSNISCDSLNGSESYSRFNCEDHGYHTPNMEDKTGSPVDAVAYEVLDAQPALRTTSDAVPKDKSVINLYEPDYQNYEVVSTFSIESFQKKKKPPPPLPSVKLTENVGSSSADDLKSLPKNLLRDIESRHVRLSAAYPNGETKTEAKTTVSEVILQLESKKDPETHRSSLPNVQQRTYEEHVNSTRSVNVKEMSAMEVDTDKFYKFHISENFREADSVEEDETFAGIKDYLSREKSSAITSAKGTIRGVKNRVKAGIATFLQMHESKSYKDKDAGKVVVYTTTMGIVRETYHKCLKVKQILRTLMIKFDERDVFMSAEAQQEIKNRMRSDAILVPQVFVEGQHIGDAETIERLNEMGQLRTILRPYKSVDACSTCTVCGGYRLLPCTVCKGSKKSIHRNHFTAEFVSLKCMNCDQVGLVKCHAC